jgi:uncharacterized membrane protein
MLQLLAIGFEGNKFTGQIIPELEEIRKRGLARLIDLVFVMKDENGVVTTIQMTDLSDEEKREFGMEVGALLGLGAHGVEGVTSGMDAGASVIEEDFGMSDEDIDEIAAEIPNNCSALVIFAEMLWSIPLRRAIMNANGRLLGQWIIQPEALVAMGAEMSAEPAAT